LFERKKEKERNKVHQIIRQLSI